MGDLDRPFLRRLSNWLSRAEWPAHGEDLRVCSTLGALNDARTKISASCAANSLSLSMASARSSQRPDRASSIAPRPGVEWCTKKTSFHRLQMDEFFEDGI